MTAWGSSQWGSDPWGSGGGSPTPPTPSSDVISTYTVDGDVTDVSPGAISTTETQFQNAIYNVVVNWAEIPGAEVQVGVSGRFVVGPNPVILRVRCGGRPLVNGAASEIVGTIVFSVTLPANTTTDLGQLSAPFTLPSGALLQKSNLQLTLQSTGGASTFDPTGLVVTLTPDVTGVGQGLLLSSGRDSQPTVTEQVTAGIGFEWLVDFDQFEDVDNLRFAFAMYEDPAFGGNSVTVRVRIGGTSFTADGDLVLAVTDPNTSQAPYDWVMGGAATVANTWTGPQLVKITCQGRGVFRPSLIIREG